MMLVACAPYNNTKLRIVVTIRYLIQCTIVALAKTKSREITIMCVLQKLSIRSMCVVNRGEE